MRFSAKSGPYGLEEAFRKRVNFMDLFILQGTVSESINQSHRKQKKFTQQVFLNKNANYSYYGAKSTRFLILTFYKI